MEVIPFDQQLPNSPNPRPLATTILLSASASSTFLEATYKWDPAAFVFLWLDNIFSMTELAQLTLVSWKFLWAHMIKPNFNAY